MQNSNSNAGTEVPQSDAAEVTTSSQTIAKPLVGGSTFKQRPKKFRFWLGHTKKMTYEHSFSEISKIIPNFTDDIIPLEFTGLKDSRNVNIYEGDIINSSYSRDTTGKDIVQTQEVVEYDINEYTGDAKYEILFIERSIVIGNIFENPELLD